MNALDRHGESVRSLLWNSHGSQELRFDAIARACKLNGKIVLDAGCGRADFLDWMRAAGIVPRRYIGVEAVHEFYRVARSKKSEEIYILAGDFVEEPSLLDQAADVIVFCGSLNTMTSEQFRKTLAIAWDFTVESLVFNFLCSPKLAKAKYLNWQPLEDVLAFARTLEQSARLIDGYVDGDATIAIFK